MTKFRNSYHFASVKKATPEKDDWRTDAAQFRTVGPKDNDAHDRYAASCGDDPRWSGRIICRLKTNTPIVIGGEQDRPTLQNNIEDYAYIKPYFWKGRPAIPATTLKGMISSIAEAASGSSLRVLGDMKPVSYRREMREALHALGMIVVDENSETGLSIRPLTLPLMERDQAGTVTFAVDDRPWSGVFDSYANHKAYIGSYKKVLESKLGRQPTRQDKISQVEASEFAGSLSINPVQTDPIGSYRNFFYMRVSKGDELSAFLNYSLPFKQKWNPSKNVTTILGQYSSDAPTRYDGEILSYEEFVNRGQPTDFVRGIIRILGVEGRQIPNKKYHELFIPYPEDIEIRSRLVPISKDAIANFRLLASQRAGDENNNCEGSKKSRTARPVRQRVPYLPFDNTEREEGDWYVDTKSGRVVAKLRPGQVVYFDIDEEVEEPLAKTISFSAIWRDCAKKDGNEAVGIRDFFTAIDGDLLPYHDRRSELTPAERLFGYVSETPSTEREHTTKYVAYAGRVRFSIAALENDPGNDSIFEPGGDQPDSTGVRHTRLKVLGSPKPPSPSLYFTQDSGQPIAKRQLEPGRHHPQGRKFYLHQPESGGGAPQPQPWKTRMARGEDPQRNLKNAVRPLKPGLSFVFHIDFDNLSEKEINLLAFSLRPTSDFRHKLGMGKSLGLGAVTIDPVALLLIDRVKRYTEDDPFSSIRWHDKAVPDANAIPESYKSDLAAAAENATDDLVKRSEDYRDWAKEIWPDAISAVIEIGESYKLTDDIPVHMPLTTAQYYRGGAASEKETFKWFAENNRTGQRQQLKPIAEGGSEFPTLKRN